MSLELRTTLFIILLICKTGFSQNFLWAKAFHGSGAMANALCTTTDSLNNIYTVGHYYSTIDWDPGPAVYNFGSAIVDDIFVVKLNSQGDFIWMKRIASSNAEVAQSVKVGVGGYVYITGSFQGVVDFDPYFATNYTLAAVGGPDIFVLKLDPSGNFVWARSMGSSGSDSGYSIELDGANNTYVTGNFSGVCDFDPSSSSVYTLAASGGSDMFVSKLDSQGNFVWAKSVGGAGNDNGRSLVLDNNGNIHVGGIFTGNADFDPSASIYTLQASGATSDAFVEKFDNNGNFLWAKQIGGSGSEACYGVDVDAMGNSYATGVFGNTADFDPGPLAYTLSSAGSSDAFVLKLDAAGNFIWASGMGGNVAESAYSIVVDSFSGDVFTTGVFNSLSCDFDPGIGTYTLGATPLSNDVFLSRLSSTGNFVSAKRIGGSNHDYGHSVTFDSHGALILTGVYYFGTGIDFDPGPATYTMASLGTDAFLCKFADCVSAPATTANIAGNATICAGTNQVYSITPVPFTTQYAWSFPASWTGTVNQNTLTVNSSTNSGVISVSAINPCGTSTIPILNLYVNQLPTLTLSASNTLICQGDSVNLLASGASTFTWNNSSTSNSITVSPNISTIYSVTGTDSFGCENEISQGVSVNLTPTLNIVTSNTIICTGQSVTITASGANSYTWNSSSTGTVFVDSPIITTTYTVSGTAANGCTTMANYIQSVSPCTYLENDQTSDRTYLYPNPTTGIITVQSNIGSEIKVLNSVGEIIYQSIISSTIEQIDITNFSNGLYLITIHKPDIILHFKLIKE